MTESQMIHKGYMSYILRDNFATTPTDKQMKLWHQDYLHLTPQEIAPLRKQTEERMKQDCRWWYDERIIPRKPGQSVSDWKNEFERLNASMEMYYWWIKLCYITVLPKRERQ